MVCFCVVTCWYVSVWLFQAGLTQKWEAAGMSSMEGEYVEFGHAVYLEGPVEVSFPAWLHKVDLMGAGGTEIAVSLTKQTYRQHRQAHLQTETEVHNQVAAHIKLQKTSPRTN